MKAVKTHKFSYPVKARKCKAQWQVDRIAARMIKENKERGYDLKMNNRKL